MNRWILLWMVVLGTALYAQTPKMLAINEDNDHYFKRDPKFMNEADLRAYVGQFKNSRVTHFFMCPQGQRASYDSKVVEPIWADIPGMEIDYGQGTDGKYWTSNCRSLRDRGIDPYTVWTDECRKIGVSPWLTMRMNDVHFCDNIRYFRNMNFWREHPELWRVPTCNRRNWTDCAFNYAKKETRDFHLAVARELLERYDVDGLELDWMRFCLHLTPNHEREEGKYLTEFVREVRKAAREWETKRGHAIRISVRVPVDPEASRALGMDAVKWAKEGLIDQIVASCFFSTADFDMPLVEWKKELGPLAEKIPVLAGTDNGAASGTGGRREMDWAMYNGWAANAWYNGADALYLFNLPYMPKLLERAAAEGLDPEDVLRRPRRHVVTYHDYMAIREGMSYGKQLPRKLDAPCEITVQFGKKPASGTLSVVAAFQGKATPSDAKFSATLNGVPATGQTEENSPIRYASADRAIRFSFPLSAAQDGINTVRISQDAGATQEIVWLEMDVH
ncbi:MAG: hypothetical protein Q4D98_00140 [Planctomycetia bacterium]|nr:hypothetical protein [Planctomycetia bacterium]